jgi:hypothetical protein
MGNHGVQIIPFYIDIQELIYAHNEAEQPAHAIQFKNLQQPQPYYFGMLGEGVDYGKMQNYLTNSGDVFLTQWGAEEINLIRAGRVTEINLQKSVATFGKTINLELVDSNIQDNTLTVTLNWQIHQKNERDLTVFVHLYDSDGQLVTQDDGYPLKGMAPFWLWNSGQTLQDERTLTWPIDAPSGTYRVGVGIYDPATGSRLQAENTSGEPIPNDALILLTVERP